MKAIHNKDYSVVKTLEAACQLTGRFFWIFLYENLNNRIIIISIKTAGSVDHKTQITAMHLQVIKCRIKEMSEIHSSVIS